MTISLTQCHNQFIAIALLLILPSIAIMLLGCPNLPTDIEDRERITGAQVFRAVVEATKYEIAPLDGAYLAYTPNELLNCLETAQWIREIPYFPEYRDCDEFAIGVMAHVKLFMPGIAFGMVKYRDMEREEVSYHFANIFVDSYLSVWMVDLKLCGDIFQPFAITWKTVMVLI